ncbi:MAG TPA: CSLREA domain-containing protein, partial [Acidimicrobiales bacterium]|nr:CSLREA domain-containing protein [Acidimicrobiales bacterium]
MRRPHLSTGLGAALVLAGAALGVPAPASATSPVSLGLLVTTTVDSHDAAPGDGVCADATGHCSLRAAIDEANAQPSGTTTTVTVPPGTYTLTLGPLS